MIKMNIKKLIFFRTCIPEYRFKEYCKSEIEKKALNIQIKNIDILIQLYLYKITIKTVNG